MALDISHLKPTIKTNKTLDYFSISELEVNQNYLDRNQYFICKKCLGDGEYFEVVFYEEIGFQRKK
jgi:hypothetical protein